MTLELEGHSLNSSRSSLIPQRSIERVVLGDESSGSRLDVSLVGCAKQQHFTPTSPSLVGENDRIFQTR